MALEQAPEPVKTICGLIAARDEWLARAVALLEEGFGPVDLASETWPFDFTDYYESQMGPGLRRRFVAFARLARPDDLAGFKRRTNAIEAALAADVAAGEADAPARPVNLDVGYLTPAKLVLASMKDFSHRICLSGGVFAEITLQYRAGRWQGLPWTFPDYASGRYDAFLSAARARLRDQQPEGRP